ncbi:sugar ABC transporter permease [Kitasatospora paracochleata]|uniref:Multiple sugar transport system permease protein n=1 Tax=Kitasatospora paracochleata TaxID=58354 RepID=A0ABT1J9R7_9ACTN|nr:sugar ABC transporter permease [Kitasatospora paracochleata]MCP2314196.1 multiple sugar transport system permease protein [Kitasatospora paracochleata]
MRIRAPHLFVLPFALLFALVYVAPVGYAIHQSLFVSEVSGLGLGPGDRTTKFVGLSNYWQALTDPALLRGVGRTLLFGVVQVPVMLGLALVLALLLDSGVAWLGGFFRLAFFLPYGIPGVIAAILWGFLYLPELSPFGHHDFLSSSTVLWSMANVTTWQWTGYNMLILFAALQAVPRELYEAARMDGAGELRTVVSVKLPMIMPALVMTGIFSIIGTLQLFSEPKVFRNLTGAVSSDYTPNLITFTEAFDNNNPHMASAIAVLLALVTCVLSFGLLKLSWRGAAEEQR